MPAAKDLGFSTITICRFKCVPYPEIERLFFVPVNSVDYVNRSQVIRRWEQLGIHTRVLIFMPDACVFNCLFI